MNMNLENSVLTALSRRGTGMREPTLVATVVAEHGDRLLDEEKILRTLQQLEEMDMVTTFPDLSGRPLWALTETGRARLREQGL